MAQNVQTSSHTGAVRFGDLTCTAVVLADGSRGYLRRQVALLFGFAAHQADGRFTQFVADLVPGAIAPLLRTRTTVQLPSGREESVFPTGILPALVRAIVARALNSRWSPAQYEVLQNALMILQALRETGEEALIDAATGYQAPPADRTDAVLGDLLRQHAAGWAAHLLPRYHRALCPLYGQPYRESGTALPAFAADITRQWVFEQALPPPLLDEVRHQQRLSGTNLQWFIEHGVPRIERQLHAITAIARCAVNDGDFALRCEAAFGDGELQLVLVKQEAA